MLPRGIGCGATRAAGAAGAVSAQNQPIVKNRTEEESTVGGTRGKRQARVYRAEEDGTGGGVYREKQFRAGPSSSSL
jgi:hypothetical protein